MMAKRINFIPAELHPKLTTIREVLPSVLVLISIVYTSSSALQLHSESSAEKAELIELEKTDLSLQKQLPNGRTLEQGIENFNALQSILSKKNYWSESFKELSLLTPDDLWLTSFANSKGDKVEASEHLVLRGVSSSQETIAKFLSKLEHSPHFFGARIISSEKELDINPVRYKFEFMVPVKALPGGEG